MLAAKSNVWRTLGVGHWNEATFSASPLPRAALLTRLAEVLADHDLRLGHRVRRLTIGEGFNLESLAAVTSLVEPWKGLSFDIIWPDGTEADVRLWRDEGGAHHLAFGESGAAFRSRGEGPQMQAFVALCTHLCSHLDMRYLAYDREPLSVDGKLAPANGERVLRLLNTHYRDGDNPGLLMLPEGELGNAAATLPANARRHPSANGLARIVFL